MLAAYGPALVLILGAIFIAAGIVAWLTPVCGEATELHLTIEGPAMAKIGDRFIARLNPKNTDGAPAPIDVDTVSWGVTGASYDIVVAEDKMSATVTAGAVGVGSSVRVVARNLVGADLADEEPLPDVEFPIEQIAVDLGLTVEPA